MCLYVFMLVVHTIPRLVLATNECVANLIKIVQEAKAPFTLEVVRSMARLCNEDPYKLWHSIAIGVSPTHVAQIKETGAVEQKMLKTQTAKICWRCTACNKTFTDVKQLVNHILFFTRQKDQLHTDLYKRVKDYSTKKGVTFTEAVEEMLKC